MACTVRLALGDSTSPVQPAGRCLRRRLAALEHVLLEVRAGAVRQGDGRRDPGLALQRRACSLEPRMQAEHRGRAAARRPAGRSRRWRSRPRRPVVRIADRQQAVHRPAADEDHELAFGEIALGGGVSGARRGTVTEMPSPPRRTALSGGSRRATGSSALELGLIRRIELGARFARPMAMSRCRWRELVAECVLGDLHWLGGQRDVARGDASDQPIRLTTPSAEPDRSRPPTSPWARAR